MMKKTLSQKMTGEKFEIKATQNQPEKGLFFGAP